MIDVVYNPNGVWTEIQWCVDRNTRSPHLTHNVSSSIFGNNIVSETSKDRETSIITGGSSLCWSDNDTFFINTNDPRSLKNC